MRGGGGSGSTREAAPPAALIAVVVLLATALPAQVRAQPPAPGLALVPLVDVVQWDAALEVDVLMANRSPVEAAFPLGEKVRAKLSVEGGQSWPVTLTRASTESAPAPIPPGGFATVRYHAELPPHAHGRTVLELEEPGVEHCRAVIDIIGGVTDGAWDSDLLERQRMLANRLAIHRPIYFIAGPKSPSSKFQISFKYRIFGFGADNGTEPTHSLQFAYTQRSLWKFGPFYDTSYMPEAFYQWAPHRDAALSAGGLTWLGLQTGWLHESNGRSGADEINERQLNIAYIRPLLAIGRPDDWYVKFEPQLWVYIFGLHNNPDLYLYRGNSALTLTVGKGAGPSVALTWLPGEHFDKGSRQIDVSIPVHIPWIDFSTYIMVQYFDGYAEALITYQQHTSAVRAGIEVVR